MVTTDDTCTYYHSIPASWGGPQEDACRHRDSESGACCERDCPLGAPLTLGDLRDMAAERRYREMVDEGGGR